MNMLKGILAFALLLGLIACGGGSSNNTPPPTPTPVPTATPTPTPTATPFPNDQHLAQAAPVKMGTTGGNATDISGGFCCSGTLGSLVQQGSTFFILSNNHVLDKSDTGMVGDPISQPGLVDNNCVASKTMTVAHLSQHAALKPSPCSGVCTGPAPSNVDASIAQIVAGEVDTSGAILDLGATPGANSIPAAPPSNTLADPSAVLGANEGVAKSGRSSGLTCSTLMAINGDIQVDYDSSCNGPKAFTAVFNNQVVINSGSFSASGDSGSLVVTSDTARPVALLYAGNSTSTSANPISDVLNAFSGGALTIVGAGDHAVSCAPQASAPAASLPPGGAAALSAPERQRIAAVQQRRSAELMQDAAVISVRAGASADNPGEGALVIELSGAPRSPIPPVIDGARTRIVFAPQAGPARMPVLSKEDMDNAAAIKESYAAGLMSQPSIQGVGVGRSDDNPAETAIVIFVISGQPHPPIPQLLDGVRTKIVEGDRFRAFSWGKDTQPAPRCKKK